MIRLGQFSTRPVASYIFDTISRRTGNTWGVRGSRRCLQAISMSISAPLRFIPFADEANYPPSSLPSAPLADGPCWIFRRISIISFPFLALISRTVTIRSETRRNPAVSGRFYSVRRVVAFLTRGLRRRSFSALKRRTPRQLAIFYIYLYAEDENATLRGRVVRVVRLSESSQELTCSGFGATTHDGIPRASQQ